MTNFTFSSRLACLTLGVFLAAAASVHAQDVRVETQQQARLREQNTQEEQAAPEQVSDPELGDINLVSRAPRPKMFTFFTGQTGNYTTNAFLVEDGAQDDFYWNGRVGASFVPYATRDFTPRLTFDQNWFRYHDFGTLDFDSQTLQLDLKYDLNHDDTWYVNGSYAVARLYAPRGSIGEFYRYGFLNVSVTHVIQLQSAPVSFSLSGGAYWRHGDPSSSDRASLYLNAAAIYNICEKVQLWGFIHPEIQHYTHDLSRSSREDFNLTLGSALNWTPRDYLSVGITATYTGNWSNVSQRSYNVVTPSLFLGAQIAF
jgi:hypothetical protein